MKYSESKSYCIGTLLTLFGFIGLSGAVETGNGFIVSIIVLSIGLMCCSWSYHLGNKRRKNEYKRIHRLFD